MKEIGAMKLPDRDIWGAYCDSLGVGPTASGQMYKWWRRYFNPGYYEDKFFEVDKARAKSAGNGGPSTNKSICGSGVSPKLPSFEEVKREFVKDSGVKWDNYANFYQDVAKDIYSIVVKLGNFTKR